MLTHQEIFDKVYIGLRDQKFQQSTNGVYCKYRYGKMKCAFGHLIPDEHYDPLIETRSALSLIMGTNVNHSLDKQNAYIKFKQWSDTVFPESLWGNIAELQRFHDIDAEPGLMQKRFIVYAEYYGLKVPE